MGDGTPLYHPGLGKSGNIGSGEIGQGKGVDFPFTYWVRQKWEPGLGERWEKGCIARERHPAANRVYFIKHTYIAKVSCRK